MIVEIVIDQPDQWRRLNFAVGKLSRSFWSSALDDKYILRLSSFSHIFRKKVPHGRKPASLSGKARMLVSCRFDGIQFRFPLVAYRQIGEDADLKIHQGLIRI